MKCAAAERGCAERAVRFACANREGAVCDGESEAGMKWCAMGVLLCGGRADERESEGTTVEYDASGERWMNEDSSMLTLAAAKESRVKLSMVCERRDGW